MEQVFFLDLGQQRQHKASRCFSLWGQCRDICIFLNSTMQHKLAKSLFKATQPSKGEKHPAVPPCPALPVGPGPVGDAGIRQQCPPALPLCSGSGTLSASLLPHSITAGIQTSPFLMNCFLQLEAETPRVPRINPSMSTLHRAVGVRAACPQELSWGHVSPHEGPWLVPGTAVNAGATFLAAQWHHARLSGGISITSWLSGISTGSTNLS